jgi:hypothetical protein
MAAANLHFCKVNLDTYDASIEDLGTDQWAVNAAYPVMFADDAEIIFIGRSLEKKAKNSELILIKVKK